MQHECWRIDFHHRRVEERILALPDGLLARFVRYTERIQRFGPDLGMPHSRAMGRGLFELRLHGAEGAARVFYCVLSGRRVRILHSFMKKSQQTPLAEFALARRRHREAVDE